jgi:hypothetical protein
MCAVAVTRGIRTREVHEEPWGARWVERAWPRRGLEKQPPDDEVQHRIEPRRRRRRRYRVSRRGYVRAPRPTTQLCSRFKEIPLSTQRAQPARRALEPRGRRAADRITAPSPRHTPYRRAWTLRGSRAESIRFAAPHIHRRLVTDLPRTRSKSARACLFYSSASSSGAQ